MAQFTHLLEGLRAAGESTRLRLRPWRETDATAYRAILGDPEVMRYMGNGLRYKFKRMAAWVVARVSDVEARRAVRTLQRHWEQWGFGEWAAEEKASGELIGRIGFVHHLDWPVGPDKVEIGWTLARPAWGRGPIGPLQASSGTRGTGLR